MTTNGGSHETPHADADLLPSIPAMPTVSRQELYPGSPNLLVVAGVRHSLGWQDHRKSGPSFVVARVSTLGTIKVKERFPLTEQGWAAAWQALRGRDAKAAAAIEAKVAAREAVSRAAAALEALDTESLRSLRVSFKGGSGEVPLITGVAYELRFLGDRIIVCPPGSLDAIVEIPYQDVEAMDVSGPGLASKTPGELVALIGGLGLLGAVLGFLFFRLVGLLLGAVIFALLGGLFGGLSARIETIVRIRGRNSEFYFLNDDKVPDALKVELSEPLMAIRNASAAQAGGSDKPAEPVSESIPDQLGKLASLLQQGMITRDEFEHLKAKLIAES